MTFLRSAILVACLASASALVVGGAPRQLAHPALRPAFERAEPLIMRKDGIQKESLDRVGSNENFGTYRRIESITYLVGGVITVTVPLVLAIWAYNEGYLTPQ